MQLIIEGHIIEIEPTAISHTLQVNDLAEIKNRNANYTNRFSIPPTPANVHALEQLGIPGNTSRIQYRKPAAKLIDNSIELISNGYAVISAFKGNYEAFIYSGNKSLTEILEGKKLNELDYSYLNHDLNLESFKASFENTSGYIHALAKYVKSESFSIYVGFEYDLNPGAIFISSLWNKIFTEAGFTYSGDIFTSEKFINTVITPTKGFEYLPSYHETLLGSVVSDNVLFSFPMTPNGVSFDHYMEFNGSLAKITNNTNALVFNYSGLCMVHSLSNIVVENGNAYIYLEINGLVVSTITPSEGDNTIHLIVNEGDVFRCRLHGYGNPPEFIIGNAPLDPLNVAAYYSMEFNEEAMDLTIDYSLLMPDTLQLSFVTDIMQRFGLMFRQRRNENHYEFIEIQKLLNDKSGAEDWSGKFIDSGEEYKIGSYARKNTMSYKYDEGVSTFADGDINVDIQHLEPTKTLFTSIFKAKQSGFLTYFGQEVYDIPIWEQAVEEGETIYKVMESDFRIFEIKRVQGTVALSGAGTNSTSLSGVLPFLDFKPCYYPEYICQYYRSFKDLLDNSKKLLATIQLDVVDIYGLDFFKLKYIEQLGKYFYLNKVSGFQTGKNSKVELVEIKKFDFNSPPTVVGNNYANIPHKGIYTFSWSDFIEDTTPPYFDPEGDAPTHIKIISLFDKATLRLNGQFVSANTIIPKGDIENGLLKAHAYDRNFSFYTSMVFKVRSENSDYFSFDNGGFTLIVAEPDGSVPLVEAGLDQVLFLPANSTTLNGTATDPSGIANVMWVRLAGNMVIIVEPWQLSTMVQNLAVGLYVFRLTATNNLGNSSSDTVTIRVWTRHTDISSVGMPGSKTMFLISIDGEPGANVTMRITTDSYTAGNVDGVSVGHNDSQTLIKTLDVSGRVSFIAYVIPNDFRDGNMTIEIIALDKGVIGTGIIHLFVDNT